METSKRGSDYRKIERATITGSIEYANIIAQWLQLNPNSLIMQADPKFISSYDSTFKFESGKSKSKLTGTDSLSWKDKSWVIGVKAGNERKTYNWNQLKKEKLFRIE